MNSEAVLGLANYEVTSIEHNGTVVPISARYVHSRLHKPRSSHSLDLYRPQSPHLR
jgi:hypothetical protein